jgi:hypothetical protein
MNKSFNSKKKNKFPTSIPTNLVDKYLKDFDATNTDSDIIESDDCFSDDDGFGFDDLHVENTLFCNLMYSPIVERLVEVYCHVFISRH